MHIRGYQRLDFSALYALDQSCFPPGIAYSKSTLRYYLSLATALCLLAEKQQSLAGFILGETKKSEAHIITLDVAEAHRRSGVGTLLLDSMEDALGAQGVRSMLIETAVNNDAAVAFWQKHGYRRERVLKRYYLGRIDGYEMRKLLPA